MQVLIDTSSVMIKYHVTSCLSFTNWLQEVIAFDYIV